MLRGLVLLWPLLLIGCDREFRFDDPVLGEDAGSQVAVVVDAAAPAEDAPAPIEAGSPQDLPSSDDANCFVGLCGWREEDCTGGVCDLECEPRTTCTGSCGTNCTARCEGASRCTLIGGDRADLECRGGGCSFVAGAGSEIRCRDGATCAVRCLGACTLDCEDASCEIQCASDVILRAVAGTVSCS